jgi:hypothetical protein
MVQPGRLERARIVEDKGKEKGSQVAGDVLSTDPDTLFPLQGALGYDLVQHLFIGEHNLVVEGTSDFTYLTIMSDNMAEERITFARCLVATTDQAFSGVTSDGAIARRVRLNLVPAIASVVRACRYTSLHVSQDLAHRRELPEQQLERGPRRTRARR